MTLLKRLLSKFSLSTDFVLYDYEFEKYQKEAKLLQNHNILIRGTYSNERLCPTCSGEFVPIKSISKTRAFTSCLMLEGSGRDYFNPQDLKQWRFNTLPFITLFLKALKIKHFNVEEINAGLVWDFGIHEINRAAYHLFFLRSAADIKGKESSVCVNSSNTAIFYLGINNASFPDYIQTVPMLDIIKGINSKGLIINRKILMSIFSDSIRIQKQNRLQENTSKGEIKKNRFPHKLPAGTNWQNITIKFLDSENVHIKVQQFKHKASFNEMGFIGKGNNPSPSVAWEFLKVLSKLNGEITFQDKEARDKYKKQKEMLAKSLQNYFVIDYDPFFPYRSSAEKQGNSYKIKITLIPPSEDNDIVSEKKENNDDELGIQEYLHEQNPQVYVKE